MPKHLFAAAIGLLLASTALPGQSPPGSPTFKSEVQYVEVDVLVTDKEGSPVRGLTKDDFTVVEDRVQQEIASFRFVELPIVSKASRTASPRSAESDIATNDGEGRTYVMLLNRGGNRARLTARRFVEEVVAANDQLAVVHVLGNMSAGQGFTRSRSHMLAAIDRIDLHDVNEEPYYWGDPTIVSFNVLEEVAKRLGGIGGRRKIILWFDPPSVFHGAGPKGAAYRFAQRDAVRAATLNNVALYVVDTQGLTTATGLSNLARQSTAVGSLERQAGLRLLAEDTGGEIIVNTNNFSDGYQRFVRDNSAYYLLGYTPAVQHRDGKFHELTVRVNRKEATVRARRGYYAPDSKETTEPAPVGGLSRKAMDALRLPSSTAGLRVDLFTAPFKDDRDGGSVVIGAQLNGTDLVLGPGEPIEVGYQAMNSEGTITPGQFHVLTLNIAPESRAEVARTGLRIVQRLQLPRGRHQVRFAVHQPNGKTGTVVADVEIPDYRQPLVMSGVVIGSHATSADRTLLSDDLTNNMLAAEPTARRRFPRDDVVTAFAEVYTQARGAADGVQVTATVATSEGRPVLAPIVSKASEQPGRVGYLARISLGDLAAGDYVLTFEARLRRESATRQVPFTIFAE